MSYTSDFIYNFYKNDETTTNKYKRDDIVYHSEYPLCVFKVIIAYDVFCPSAKFTGVCYELITFGGGIQIRVYSDSMNLLSNVPFIEKPIQHFEKKKILTLFD